MKIPEEIPLEKKQAKQIRIAIIEGYTAHARSFPWKETQDPYKIWLSEIILQQTRTEQGLPYYLKITQKYPDIPSLAKAKEEPFLKDWEGLGYYSRARNMLAAARYMMEHHQGTFPNTYEEILALKGVGPYTAAAIASFAFGLRYPVVDGNVLRLFSRLFGITAPVDVASTVRAIRHIACTLMDNKTDPAIFNQAIMDLGASVCTPKQPKCAICPVRKYCRAYRDQLIDLLPVKSKTLKKKSLYYNYFYIPGHSGTFALTQRDSTAFWKKMYQFPLLEDNGKYSTISYLQKRISKEWNYLPNHLQPIAEEKQTLSHRHIHARLFVLDNFPPQSWQDNWIHTSVDELTRLPLPKLMKTLIGRHLQIP